MDSSALIIKKFEELDNDLYIFFSNLFTKSMEERERISKKTEEFLLDYLKESSPDLTSKENLKIIIKSFRIVSLFISNDCDFINVYCKKQIFDYKKQIGSLLDNLGLELFKNCNSNKEAITLNKSIRYNHIVFGRKLRYMYESIYENVSENMYSYVGLLTKEMDNILYKDFKNTSLKLRKFVNKYISHFKKNLKDIFNYIDKCAAEEELLKKSNKEKETENNIEDSTNNYSLLNYYIEDNYTNVDEIPKEILEKSKDLNINIQEQIITSKIFNYKEINSLAISNGYTLKYQNGTSHAIFEHSKTNKIVCIPQHSLGIGLSKKIQKQIISGSVS